MDLWDIQFGRIYCSKLLKCTRDRISDCDVKFEEENYKQCLIIFLITTYKILIGRTLISKEVLSETYIRN